MNLKIFKINYDFALTKIKTQNFSLLQIKLKQIMFIAKLSKQFKKKSKRPRAERGFFKLNKPNTVCCLMMVLVFWNGMSRLLLQYAWFFRDLNIWCMWLTQRPFRLFVYFSHLVSHRECEIVKPWMGEEPTDFASKSMERPLKGANVVVTFSASWVSVFCVNKKTGAGPMTVCARVSAGWIRFFSLFPPFYLWMTATVAVYENWFWLM